MAATRYLNRSVERCVRRVSEQFPELWLTGARQTGKTTLLRHVADPARGSVSLDDPAVLCLAPDEVPIDGLTSALPLGAL